MKQFMMLSRLVISVVAFLLIISLIPDNTEAQQITPTPEPTNSMSGMDSMMEAVTGYSVDDLAPLVRGLYDGEEVLFLHTETSDERVANLLTEMMGPEFIVVSSLAQIPQELLGNVYVFTNGIAGDGPLGFQLDIFDSIPGDEDYTPLRQLNRVSWTDDTAYLLNNVPDLLNAEEAGEIEIEPSGIVINMPILVWGSDQR